MNRGMTYACMYVLLTACRNIITTIDVDGYIAEGGQRRQHSVKQGWLCTDRGNQVLEVGATAPGEDIYEVWANIAQLAKTTYGRKTR